MDDNHISTFRSQTCKYKEGGDWAKRWVENQVYILKVKCPLIGHYCLHLKIIVFTRGRDNCCTFASNFDLIFCNCFKAGEQKMRPCAFMIFLYANLLRGRVVSFRGEKVIKDGGHQGK